MNTFLLIFMIFFSSHLFADENSLVPGLYQCKNQQVKQVRIVQKDSKFQILVDLPGDRKVWAFFGFGIKTKYHFFSDELKQDSNDHSWQASLTTYQDFSIDSKIKVSRVQTDRISHPVIRLKTNTQISLNYYGQLVATYYRNDIFCAKLDDTDI